MFAFKQNKNRIDKQQQVWRVVTRLVDGKTPNRVPEVLNNREFERYSRSLPVVCFPLVDNKINGADVFNGVTRDFSDGGTSIIADLKHTESSNLEGQQVICGFWDDGPILLDGRVRRQQEFGGDLTEIGVEFFNVVNSASLLESLKPFLEKLHVNK